jgi:hypothetical protein
VHACTEDLKSMMAWCKSDGICFVSDQDFDHTHCAFWDQKTDTKVMHILFQD